MTPPTRAEVREWLRQLAAGEIDRATASALATPWIAHRDDEITDRLLFPPLSELYMADGINLPSG